MQSVLILPDTHSYNVDKKAWGAMINYASKHVWNNVVHLGDLLEGDSISSHNKLKLKTLEGQRLQKDYDFANKLLTELEQATDVGQNSPPINLLLGNHEYRVERYIDEHPAMDGMINVDKGLFIDKRERVSLVRCYPHGEIHPLGKLNFTHGRYTGGNPCKKHLDVYGTNIVFGHTHEVGIYSKVTYGKGKTIAAYNIGCLCRYDMPYLEGAATNWQHAFATAFILPNGNFNLTIHMIFNGEFVADGVKYSYRN